MGEEKEHREKSVPASVKQNRRWREWNHKEDREGIVGNEPREMRKGVTKKI